jgi:hypothetical protein
MRETRRSLLRALSWAAAALLISRAPLGAQDPTRQPVRPGDDDPSAPTKSSTKAILQENQKDIKKSIEKLFDLALQLKDQVEKTDSTTVLSVALVKKAEEIEKLARQIKERAKG